MLGNCSLRIAVSRFFHFVIVQHFGFIVTSFHNNTCKKLEKKEYICGKTIIQSDRPNKKIFSITETGKKSL